MHVTPRNNEVDFGSLTAPGLTFWNHYNSVCCDFDTAHLLVTDDICGNKDLRKWSFEAFGNVEDQLYLDDHNSSAALCYTLDYLWLLVGYPCTSRYFWSYFQEQRRYYSVCYSITLSFFTSIGVRLGNPDGLIDSADLISLVKAIT